MPVLYPSTNPTALLPTSDLPGDYPVQNSNAGAITSVARGLKSSLLGMDANTAAADYYRSLATNDQPKAQANGLRAQQLLAETQRAAPRVQSVGDIHGPSDAGDWVAGQAGALPGGLVAPVLGGLAGAVVGRRFGAGAVSRLGAAGGVAAMYPDMRDAALMERMQSQQPGQAAPNPEQAKEALNQASWQGAAQSLPYLVAPELTALPRVLGGKPMLTPAKTFAGGVARGAAIQGAAGTLSTEIGHQFQDMHNPNRDTSQDAMQNLDAFASNALIGLPFEAMGHAGTSLHSGLGEGASIGARAAEAAGKGLIKAGGKGAEMAAEAWANRPTSLDDAALKVGQGAAALHTGAEDLMTRMAQRGKDPDIDTLLAPQTGSMSQADWTADNTAKHAAAESFISKLNAQPDAYPEYVREAAQKYNEGSKLMDSWKTSGLADSINDWKRAQGFNESFTEFTQDAALKLGKGAATARNFADNVKDVYNVDRDAAGRRQNAQTPEMRRVIDESRDELSPLIDEALRKQLPFKTKGAQDDNLPAVTHGMREWISNGFSMRAGGDPVVPDGLLGMFKNPAAAITAVSDLMMRQGIVSPDVIQMRARVLEQLAVKQESRKDMAQIVGDNLTPVALSRMGGFSMEGNHKLASELLYNLRHDQINSERMRDMFGPNARTVLDALRTKSDETRNAISQRVLGESIPENGGERTMARTSDQQGSSFEDRVPNNEDMAQMTNTMDPNIVRETAQYHHYRKAREGESINPETGEILNPGKQGAPAEPYKVGGAVTDKTGKYLMSHDEHAAKLMAELQARNDSTVKKVGYLEHLRDQYGNAPDDLMHHATDFMKRHEKEIRDLPGTGSAEEKINKNWYVLREEHRGAKGEATNIAPREFDALGSKKHKWAEYADGDAGTSAQGRVWLERKNADGTKTQFATSTSKIIRRMSEASKAEGRDIGDGDRGLAGQHALLHQGLASLMTNEALSGRVGFKDKANGQIKWLNANDKLPDSLRMHSTEGKTYADARRAVEQGRTDKMLSEAGKLVERWRDQRSRTDSEWHGSELTKRIDALQEALDTKDYKHIDNILRKNALDIEASALKKEKDATPELQADGGETRVAFTTHMIDRNNEGKKFATKKEALEYAGGNGRVVKNEPGWYIERKVPQEKGLPKIERINADSDGQKFSTKEAAAKFADGNGEVLRREGGWIIEREIASEVREGRHFGPTVAEDKISGVMKTRDRVTGADVPLETMEGRKGPRSLQEDMNDPEKPRTNNDYASGGGELHPDDALNKAALTRKRERQDATPIGQKAERTHEDVQAQLAKGLPAFNSYLRGLQPATRMEIANKLRGILRGEATDAIKARAEAALKAFGGSKTEGAKSESASVREIALQAQKDAGWNTDWPFVPADLGNADFRRQIASDPGMTAAEKAQVFDAGVKLGVVPKEHELSARANAQKDGAFGSEGKAPASEEERTKFFADTARRLGPDMKAALEESIGGIDEKTGKKVELSGEWTKGAIRASIYARNIGQIGAHEAMHEFFSRLSEAGPAAEKVLDVLNKAANSPYVVRQMQRLLHEDTNTAALWQIGAKGAHQAEERMAYMFQFHQAGLLKIGPETATMFQKVATFLRKMAGLLNNDQKADAILRAFDQGKTPTADAAAKFLANNVEAREKMYKDVNRALSPVIDKVSRLVNTAETNLERHGNKEYHEIRRMFKRSVGESGPQGFLDAKDHMMKQWSNKLAAVFEGLQPKDIEMAARYLHTNEKAIDPIVKDIVAKIKGKNGILPAMEKYLQEAGVQRWDAEAEGHNGKKGAWVSMGHVENYFPHAYDTAAILKDPNGFATDLIKHNGSELAKIAAENEVTVEDVAKGITNRLINTFGQAGIADNVTDGVTVSVGGGDGKAALNAAAVGFSPFMQAINKRDLHWIAPEILAKYGDKDVASVMTSYIAQGIKRAEYVRRFGNGGEVLKEKLGKAYDAQLKKFMDSGMAKVDAENKALKIAKGAATDVMAMEGTLGYDINPKLRKFENSMLVYQNMRTLSTSLFSQFIDPLGLVVRGGTMKDAWESYKRGIREVVASIKGDPIKDLDARIADQIGTTDANGFLAAFGQLYSSQYMGSAFRHANDVLFKYNGMEGFNRGMQVSATRTAINFIKRHVETPNERSKDYLGELNLTAKDVKIGKNGELDYTDPKIQRAVHQWVNGSVMRPNAAQRPAWGSDPHYMIFWHMKQFAYTFHDVIMKRAMHDVKKYGDMGPAGVLVAAYTPMMIAADTMKSLLLTQQEPTWMKMGLGAEIEHGAMRAGLAGKFQPGVDTMAPGRSILGLGGPVVEQISQLFGQSPQDAVVNALPGANVWNTIGGKPGIELQGDE